ncbi:hypothetical protein Tco_0250259 [Tanacetum coccineum]
MVLMVPYEAFACPCEAGDEVLRESYKPKTRGKLYYACPRSKPRQNTFGCEFFYGKRNEFGSTVGSLMELQRLIYSPSIFHRLHFYSPVSSPLHAISPGGFTTQAISKRTLRSAEWLNCSTCLER